MEEIKLNKENEITYNRLLRILEKNGRVAIIQPTGTGKSMVSLKYLQDNPDKKVLYITSYNLNVQSVKDKIEHYGGFGQVETINYRNLILDDIPDFDYDVIILDEFHHCGADVTSVMLEKLISKYPNAKVIGTTATPIRYLDNGRDMTEELFGGITARNMTLSYAIANKILPEFTYIAGLYGYDYSELIQEYTERAAELEGEDQRYYLSLVKKLSECLIEASGINQIFKKYMNPSGKYVVFCDSKEQMEEIIAKISKKEIDWFDGIDSEPEFYSVYYGNDSKDNIENFASFKESKTNHVKLLFNINMASEGMHLNDIDGVIMFRRTASMNVYIQQLGRALAVDTETNPIIFDFANNISNQFIYDFLGNTRDEIKKGIDEGKEDLADIRKIRVIDEVKGINDVLRKLNSVPITDWDRKFMKVYESGLFEYTYNSDGQEFLDLSALDEIPSEMEREIEGWIDYDGLNWLKQQIKDYKNNRLSYPKIKKLQAIGAISMRGQFNEEDIEYFNRFCDSLLPTREGMDRKLNELPFEEQFFLVKEFVCKYYYRKNNQNYSMEDYIQTCLFGLFNAKKTYTGKGSYKQFVERCIINELIISLPTESQSLSFDDISSITTTLTEDMSDKFLAKEIIESIENDDISKLYTLTPSQRMVIKYRFGLMDGIEHTYVEIGELMGISSTAVGFYLKEGLKKIRRQWYLNNSKHDSY